MHFTMSETKKYMSGEMSPEQEKSFRKFLTEEGNSKEVTEELYEIFKSMEMSDLKMADDGFKEFNRRLGREKSVSGFRKFASVAIKVAACMVIPLLCAAGWLALNPEPDVAWVEVRVPNGQIREIELSDGSVLRLNAGSRITYPTEFRGEERLIFMDGEVLAEVAKDSKHPFIIESDDVRVRVLGTKFDMKSYSTDQMAEVRLLEGSVSLECGRDLSVKQVVMTPGDRAQFSRATDGLEVSKFDTANNKSFVDGDSFQFYNTSLSDIVRSLERHFGVDIIILNSRIEDEKYFAFFTGDDGLEEILLSLDIDGKMKITYEDGKVFIR